MCNTVAGAYLYQNLKPLYSFNERTTLCMFEPTFRLYVLKKADKSCALCCNAVASQRNPHLADIVYVAEHPDSVEIVREYIAGDTLADLIGPGRALSPDRAARIAADICDGLGVLHRSGYVHRDITPNNIIVLPDGGAKIIDYGIARSFLQNKPADTVILGTPGYAAPEQFGFSQSDARTDIYAVGVLFNVMLTGKLPHEQLAAGVFGKIIRKCIEIDSKRRYKKIAELGTAIRRHMPDETSLGRVLRQIPGLRSSHPVIVILAAVAYFCAVFYTVGLFAGVKNGAYAQTAVYWIFNLPIPFLCFHNVFNIWERLPFSRGASKRNQRITYILLGIASILFGIVCYSATV